MKYSAIIPQDGKLHITWYILFIVNFFIMGGLRYFNLPFPTSFTVEIVYFLCILGAMSTKRFDGNAKRFSKAIFIIYLPWLAYSILEAGNVSTGIAYNDILTRWFAEVRTMAFQVIYGMLICSAIFVKKEQLKTMYKVWGICIIICTVKTYYQQHVGFDAAEKEFLTWAYRTHFVNGIIRYFSLFSDAANYGCNMAATTAVFGAVTLSCKNKKEKIFFALITACSLYGMMASGTRTGMFVLAAGAIVYAALSKKVTAIVTTAVLGGLFFAILMFTNIGQGNPMIRRMRSAFSKDDASMSVREMNQMAMKKYIDELPLGLGAGLTGEEVPPSNKNHYLAVVAPDSTWVYVNIHYGNIGKYIFLFSFIGMCIVGGFIVFFRIRDPELRGLLAGLVSGASAMVLAGYANQIMLQYPNCFLFFGQLMIVYLGPHMDKKIQEEQEERDRRLLLSEEQSLETT